MRSVLSTIVFFLVVSIAATSCANDNGSEPEVRFAEAGQAPPTASLDDIAWFEGLWIGTVFGGPVEHRVMSPHDRDMPGLVRLRSGETDETFLYELSSFSEVDGTLTYRNRLFDPRLETVGEGEDVTDRTLVALDEGIAYFDGITFAPDGPDKAVVAFILTGEDGTRTRHVVNYRKVGPAD